MEAEENGPTGGSRQFYGRRRGKKLRANRADLIRTLLPRLSLPADALAPAPLGQVPSMLDPRTWFDSPVEDIWLEIGFGGGEHLTAQAAAHPRVGFLGAEPFINGVAALLAAVERQGLGNLRLLADDVRPLLPRLVPGSLGRVFVLFPDPWPKQRHQRRRIVSRAFLDHLAQAMAGGAELRLATDHMDYARWILARVMDHPDFEWVAGRARDWREPPVDWQPTRYEAKARAAGRPPVFLRVLRCSTA